MIKSIVKVIWKCNARFKPYFRNSAKTFLQRGLIRTALRQSVGSIDRSRWLWRKISVDG